MAKSLEFEKKYWSNHKKILKKYLDLKILKIEDFKDKIVCEIGCGATAFIFNLDNPKLKIGIDPLMDFYKEKQFIPDIDGKTKLYNSSAENLSFIDSNSIDIVLSLNMLDHVQDPRKIIQECNRILKSGGILFIQCNIVKNFLTPIRKLLKIIDKPHPYHFNLKDFASFKKEGNFEIIYEEIEPIKIYNNSFKLKIGSKLMNTLYIIFRKQSSNF